MIKTKVRLQGLAISILSLGALVVIFTIMGFKFWAAMCAVVVFYNFMTEWPCDDLFLSRYLAKSSAIKFFQHIFEFSPPSSRDSFSIKVCQPVVNEKLKKLRDVYDNLYTEENQRISVQSTPKGMVERIASNRELHIRVEAAKTAYENAKWLAQWFFEFDTAN